MDVCVSQPSTLGPYPRPLAPISSALVPQNIERLNTILLFNFEVVYTLKLYVFFSFYFHYKECKKQKITK